MSITLTNLIEDCRIQLADAQASASPFWDSDDLTLYLNNSLLTLWSLLPDDALRNYNDVAETNLVSATSEYPLPADYYIESTVMVNDIPARKVRYAEYAIWENNIYLKPLHSQPAYTTKGSNIVIFPDPAHDAASGLRFFYLKVPPTLATGTDTVLIDASYSPIIVGLACGRAMSLKESVEEGKVLIDSALEDLKILLGKDTKEEEEAVKQ